MFTTQTILWILSYFCSWELYSIKYFSTITLCRSSQWEYALWNLRSFTKTTRTVASYGLFFYFSVMKGDEWYAFLQITRALKFASVLIYIRVAVPWTLLLILLSFWVSILVLIECKNFCFDTSFVLLVSLCWIVSAGTFISGNTPGTACSFFGLFCVLIEIGSNHKSVKGFSVKPDELVCFFPPSTLYSWKKCRAHIIY